MQQKKFKADKGVIFVMQITDTLFKVIGGVVEKLSQKPDLSL
jgi:hypothetical protein